MTVEEKSAVYLPIEGMDSEHCAMLIGKGLSTLKELDSYQVELNNNRVQLTSKQLAGAIAATVQKIRALGYKVPTVKKTFPLLNMTCASCASSAQTILAHQPGVVNVAVNYANATAQIEYVSSLIQTNELKEALQSIGYDLMIEEREEAKDSLDALQQKRYQLLRNKTIGAILLSVPVMILGMFFMDLPYANFLMWGFSTPVVFVFGKQFFVHAWKQAKHQSANMDTLVALSTGVAYLFSVFNTLFQEFWHSRGLHAHVYFEASAVVIAFILLGKLLEEKAKGKTSSAIKKLMGLQPKTVTIIQGDSHEMEVPLNKVKEGDVILVKPGEKIAVDGTVIGGYSFVDESMISGEPIAVEKKNTDLVFAGTINQKGSFKFRTDKVGAQTMLAQIIKMVEDAQGSKAPVQKRVDKIAAIFVPVVMGVAIISFITWLVLGGSDGFTHGLLALVTVLVIACPCALGLATPTAIMVGVGKGASVGILIKDAESIEMTTKVNAVVLDKTGTITEGKPVVTDIKWFAAEQELVHVFAALEKQSEHPLADAIVKHFHSNQPVDVVQFESLTGLGAKAIIHHQVFLAGNAKLMDTYHIRVSDEVKHLAEKWLKQAKTVVYFADEKEVLALVAITDRIKPTSIEAVKQLHALGISVYMLTGDNKETAAIIAQQAGIRNYYAEVLPADKSAFVKQLQQEGKIVAMVGDGINDSNALAQADVSIAMGTGSDIAMDVAKMTIISADLTKVSKAINLSKQTVKTIKQNLFWAFIYNVIGIPIAAGVLYPINGFLLDPMIAGAAMALSSVSVVSNSLLLKVKKI